MHQANKDWLLAQLKELRDKPNPDVDELLWFLEQLIGEL